MYCQYVGSSATPAPPAPAPPTMMKATATNRVPALPSAAWMPTAARVIAATTSAKHGKSVHQVACRDGAGERAGHDAGDDGDCD